LRERLASPLLERPSHALGIPARVSGNGSCGYILLLQDYADRAVEAKSGDGLESGKITEMRPRLDESGIVGGAFIEIIRGFLEGASPIRVPNQKSSCRSGHATDEPNELFHTCFPSLSLSIRTS
jgi:hypothetical protein